MGINLDAIRNRLKSLQASDKKSNNIWKPTAGKTTIRIVPYAYNKENPFVELYFHYRLGKKSYLSLETFGEKDPVVEFSDQLKETGSKEDWVLGKKLEPTLRTFVPVIIRGKEKEGVKFWGFGKNIYQELLTIMSDPDYGDITDPKSGRDITIEFIPAAQAGNTYGTTKMLVKPNSSVVTDDREIIDLIVNHQTNIDDVYKKPTYEELKEALEQWLNPSEETTEESTTDTPAVEESAKELEVKKDVKAPTAKVEKKTDSVKKVDDVGKAFDDLFKKMK